MNINNKTIGFIILRHVNNEESNNYWIYSYNCIREYYSENNILIIDDNSKYEYITNIELYKTTIINSEYKGRGELLPYYYYLHNKLFDIAVIIHDSVFINKYIDFYTDKYIMIWEFNNHEWDNIEDETNIIKLFDDNELLEFYKDKSLWSGCFGAMCIISHDFLIEINNKYEINKLLDVIKTRHNRCSFERVISCLLQKTYEKKVLLGNIHNYCEYGCIQYKFKSCFKQLQLPIIKMWAGR